MASYQFKVTLLDSYSTSGPKTKIWRRIVIPINATFHDLHELINKSMGWENYHVHRFLLHPHTGIIDSRNWLSLGPDGQERLEKSHRLINYFASHSTAKYLYDTGDNWLHAIEKERELIAPHPYQGLRECIDGEMACPPEDVGGYYGYLELLEAIRDINHKDHKEMHEWLESCGYTNFDETKRNEKPRW